MSRYSCIRENRHSFYDNVNFDRSLKGKRIELGQHKASDFRISKKKNYTTSLYFTPQITIKHYRVNVSAKLIRIMELYIHSL